MCIVIYIMFTLCICKISLIGQKQTNCTLVIDIISLAFVQHAKFWFKMVYNLVGLTPIQHQDDYNSSKTDFKCHYKKYNRLLFILMFSSVVEMVVCRTGLIYYLYYNIIWDNIDVIIFFDLTRNTWGKLSNQNLNKYGFYGYGSYHAAVMS